MLIDNQGPQIMPVPQPVTMIQSPNPMIQVMPAAFQPVPYFPSSMIPGAGTPLEFVPADIPQVLVNQSNPYQQVIQRTAGAAPAAPLNQPVSVKFSSGGGSEVKFDMQMGQPQAQAPVMLAVPYQVQARNGGMIATGALNGLGESSPSPLLALAALAALYYLWKK